MIRDYSDEIDRCWTTIECAWNEHADKHPIIECDPAKTAGQLTPNPGGGAAERELNATARQSRGG